MIRIAILMVVILYSVLGQTNQFEQECNILQNLEDLQSRLDNAEKRLQEQDTVLAEQEEHIKQQSTEITNLKDSLSADAHKPPQVFYVLYTGAKNPGTNKLLPFGTAMMNPDGLYDTGTGYFTAKTGGLYLFTVHFCSYQGTYINLLIYVNEDFISDATTYDATGNVIPCSSSTAVAMVSVGDKVSVKTGPNISTSGLVLNCASSRWCTFMGVLIH